MQSCAVCTKTLAVLWNYLIMYASLLFSLDVQEKRKNLHILNGNYGYLNAYVDWFNNNHFILLIFKKFNR